MLCLIKMLLLHHIHIPTHCNLSRLLIKGKAHICSSMSLNNSRAHMYFEGFEVFLLVIIHPVHSDTLTCFKWR